MNKSLLKQEITQLIKNSDVHLVFGKPKTSSFQAWLTFSYVYINNQKQDFVCCDICKEVLHHKPMDGTSSMIKHKRICEQTKKNIHNNSTSIQGYFRPKTIQPILTKLKEKVTSAVVEFVCLDNRAFELIASDGFIHLAQIIFNVGQDLYKSHDIYVSNLLPDARTVSTYYSKKHCLSPFVVIG